MVVVTLGQSILLTTTSVVMSTPEEVLRNVFLVAMQRLCKTRKWSTDTGGRGSRSALWSAIYQSMARSTAVGGDLGIVIEKVLVFFKKKS